MLKRSLLRNQLLSLQRFLNGSKVLHYNYTAYDYYSIDEFDRNGPGNQWQSLCLPGECNEEEQTHDTSALPTQSNLALLTGIYVITGQHLHDRHRRIRNVFVHHSIPKHLIHWRWKWNMSTCKSLGGRKTMYQKMNIIDGDTAMELTNMNQEAPQPDFDDLTLRSEDTLVKQEPVTIEHVDLWYELAETNGSFSLVLEDDAILVPFFKQKFNRFVYEASRKGALSMSTECAFERSRHSLNLKNMWLNQDPILVFGSCFNLHGPLFEEYRFDAKPTISAQKLNASRCSHAYLLTACSAKALVKQIRAKKNRFQASDYFLRQLVADSPTLQSFWLDPPLVYQGNQVVDLDFVSTFQKRSY